MVSGAKVFGKAGEVADKTNLNIGFRGELYSGGDSTGILTVKLQPDNEKYYLLEIVGDSRGLVNLSIFSIVCGKVLFRLSARFSFWHIKEWKGIFKVFEDLLVDA